MKSIAVVLFVVLAGCSDPKQSVERAFPDKLPDSAARADYEDSLMGELVDGGPGVVTRHGDTLASFGGWSIDVQGPPWWYEIDHYSRNGIHYLSIERRGEHKPVGGPIWSRWFTLRLPSMDSSDRVVLHGYCRINGKDDRLIIAIAGTEGDSFYRPARHAWRFNVNREALEEIPIAGVTCSLVNPEGH